MIGGGIKTIGGGGITKTGGVMIGRIGIAVINGGVIGATTWLTGVNGTFNKIGETTGSVESEAGGGATTLTGGCNNSGLALTEVTPAGLNVEETDTGAAGGGVTTPTVFVGTFCAPPT